MKEQKPLVSIIVPTYNVEQYARECFDSLISQTLENIEIILIDDGSTDLSGKICDEYALKDTRIKVIHQTNRGLGLSRNSGLRLAEGEYIGFVDSDDCVSWNMFEILYENAMKYTADISYCTYKKFSYNSELKLENEVHNLELKIWKGENDIRQYMLDRIGLPPQNRKDNLYAASVGCGIFSRKFITEIGVEFVSERQFIAEDMIFDIDVIPHCNVIVHCNMPLYYYRNNQNSLTTRYRFERFERNVELYREMYRRLKKYYTKEECFSSMSRYLLTTSRVALIQEARFVNQNGFWKACSNSTKICKTQELQQVLSIYPFWKLPWKYRIICILEKFNFSLILLLICMLQIKDGSLK